MALLITIWELWCDMAPYLAFGLVMAGLIHVFLSKEQVSKHLGGKNLGSVVKASLFGIPLPLCSCGVLPTGLSLYREGSSKGAAVSFLISTPQTGIDSLLVTYGFLGPAFAILKPVAAFVSGVMGGIFTNGWDKDSRASEVTAPKKSSDSKKKRWIYEGLRYGFVDFLYNFAHYLVAGIVIAGIAAYFIPSDFFSRMMGGGFLSMLLIILLGLPLYVCSSSSVPIAHVMLLKGLSPGAALVFLMVGPATNMATITSIAGMMGLRVATIYLGSIVVTSLAFGTMLNWLYHLIPAWFPQYGAYGATMLPTWVKTCSAVILALFTLYALYKRAKARLHTRGTCRCEEQCSIENEEVLHLKISNMNCSHCAGTVENLLSELEGTSSVRINLKEGEGVVKGQTLDSEKILSLLSEHGYPSSVEKSG